MTLKQEEVITAPLYDLEVKTGVIISPLVTLKKRWESRPFKTPFYVNLINFMKEGIVVIMMILYIVMQIWLMNCIQKQLRLLIL